MTSRNIYLLSTVFYLLLLGCGPGVDESNHESDASPDAPTGADADADGDADSDTDSDGDIDADTDTDTDADADSDIDSGPDSLYQWHTFWDENQVYSITADSDGYVYVVGSCSKNWTGPSGENPIHAHGDDGIENIFILKLSTNGEYLWHTFYGYLNGNEARGIALDSQGNVLVTGMSDFSWDGPESQPPKHSFTSGFEMNNLFVLKLSSSGEYQWHTFYGYGSNQSLAVAHDSSDAVYVTGASDKTWNGPAGQVPLHAHGGDGYGSIVVLKLSAGGDYQWHTFHGEPLGNSGSDIAVDSNGYVYVAGTSANTWDGPSSEPPLHAHSGLTDGSDIVVLKLASNGEYQWHTFFGSKNQEEGRGIALDQNGGLYIAGTGEAGWNGPVGQAPLNEHTHPGQEVDAGTSGSKWMDLVVLKLTNNGEYQWHTFYGSMLADYGVDIAADSNGSQYITGSSDSSWNGPNGEKPIHHSQASDGTPDISILKLSMDGEYQWHSFYGSDITDEGRSIAIDGNSNVYVTGDSNVTWNGPNGEPPLHDGSHLFVLKLHDAP